MGSWFAGLLQVFIAFVSFHFSYILLDFLFFVALADQ
jgi:hypothetical protein